MKNGLAAIIFLCIICFFGGCQPWSADSSPVIWTFDVIPDTCARGGSVVVYWTVLSADTVSINHNLGNVSLAGSASVTFDTVGTFTVSLTAENGAGSTSISGNVEVIFYQSLFGEAHEDEAYCCRRTNDGGSIITGVFSASSNVSIAKDVWLIKADADGNKVWDRTFGGGRNDVGRSVVQAADGGYVVVGESLSFGGGYQIYLLKTDASGNTMWEKTVKEGTAYAVKETSDGGFVIAASNGYLIKTDPAGNVLWQNRYCTSGNYDSCTAHDVIQTSDGGYVMTGKNWFSGKTDYDVYLVKTDASGNKLWYKNYGGNGWDIGNAVIETADGGFLIAGYTGAGDSKVYLVKTDGAGNKVWENTYDGYEAYSVIQTADGNYAVAGNHLAEGDMDDVYVLKIDGSGAKIWEKIIGGEDHEIAKAIYQTNDGNFVVAGRFSTGPTVGFDVLLMKIAGQ